MSSELGDTLYISLPTVNEDWVDEHEVEFWVGGVSAFRSIQISSWGDAFEKHYEGLKTERPQRWSAVSDRCDAAAVGAVTDIANKHFKDAGLWEHVVATSAEIETYNETIKSIFHSIAAEIADAWAAHFGIEI